MAMKEQMTQEAFSQMLEKMTIQREAVLALVRPLSNTMRNWKPNNAQMNIHEILLHIGSSECQTISRLGQKVSPPSEVTLMRYLHQSREIVLSRLQALTEAERSQTFDDGWTATRVLDHILNYEREQMAQIETIMAQWRLHLTARMAAERAGLFSVLLGLSAEQLTSGEPMPGWSVKDVLAHVAFWDGFHANRMQKVADGRIQEIVEIGDDADLDDYNQKLLADFKEVPLEQVVAMLFKERSGFLQLMKRLSDPELQGQIRLPWGWRTHLRVWAKWRYQHDAEHARQIRAWRKELPRHDRRHVGPKYLLRGLLKVCRQEFLALLPLLLESEWNGRSVCGVWTMKDLVGHLAAWAEVGGQAVSQALAGKTPELPPIADFNAWNMDEAAKRADLPWEQVWQAYETSYQTLLDGLDALSDEALSLEFTAPWGPKINLYRWFTIWPLHEREHAIDVRQALNLTRWPKRLLQHPS